MQPQLFTRHFAQVAERVLECGEHAKAKEVELHEPGVCAVVLIPLEHGTAGHARPFHRAHVDDRAVTQDHAAGVDAQVSREPHQAVCQV